MVRFGKIAGCGLLEICMENSHEEEKKCCSHYKDLSEAEDEYHEDSEQYFAIKRNQLFDFILVLRAFSHSSILNYLIYIYQNINLSSPFREKKK